MLRILDKKNNYNSSAENSKKGLGLALNDRLFKASKIMSDKIKILKQSLKKTIWFDEESHIYPYLLKKEETIKENLNY